MDLEKPRHSRQFRIRRFLNWFPLGLTYSLFYMGRYNLSVASPQIMEKFSLTNTEWGAIITAGFWTYALSFVINGPLTDRYGGKKAIILGGLGAAVMNIAMAIFVGFGLFATKIVVAFSFLYALDMYFQSFGAVSIVKVNSTWFHVRERGIFGGIFGILISLGYQLAYGVGAIILVHFPLIYVFIIPSILLTIFVLLDIFIIKDKPSEAGFEDFDTADASSGVKEEVNFSYILKRIFTNRVVFTIAIIEFCTGVIRNGTMQWLPKYLSVVFPQAGASELGWYGTGLFLVGIAGGMSAGFISDRVFGSRRPPVAGIFYVFLIGALILLGNAWSANVAVIAAVVAAFFFIGIHGMLSGTASMDFGGTKGAASAAGIIDGFVYLGSGVSGVFLGFLIDKFGWGSWAYMLIPFGIVGLILNITIWNVMPKSRKTEHEEVIYKGAYNGK
ncbi:MAG: MFS transporter [Calditrichia bacterium]